MVAGEPEDSSNPHVIPENQADYDETWQHHIAVAVNDVPARGAGTFKVNLKPKVVTQNQHRNYDLMARTLCEIFCTGQVSENINTTVEGHISVLTEGV